MPHPWDLHLVWQFSTCLRLQLECVARGILGSECAAFAHLELSVWPHGELVRFAQAPAEQRAPRRRARL